MLIPAWTLITWMAVSAATMAGDPNPWVIMEKWVRCLWMPGSRIMEGLVLHSGLRSWFRRSISSLVTSLDTNMALQYILDIGNK